MPNANRPRPCRKPPRPTPGNDRSSTPERWLGRYLVLVLLRDGISHHGYALAKESRQRLGRQMSSGHFYNTLRRLAAEGLVVTASNPSS